MTAEGMRETILALPEHIQAALALPIRNFEPRTFTGIDKIAFLGMGGSGIAGNIIRDLLPSIPVFLNKGYAAPGFLDRKTLAICISYSGNTKETLEATHTAMKKNCRLLGLASGGKMLELLVEEGRPHIALPPGHLPRTSLPFQLFSLLNFFDQINLFPLDREGILAFARALLAREPEARALAEKLKGKLVFIYGSTPSVGLRFKTQLNENAKVHAKAEVFPELNHNEVVAWQEQPPQGLAVVFLREPDERQEVRDSISFLQETIQGRADLLEIQASGQTRVEQVLSLIFLGDLASYHLALARRVDPEKTEYINTLKKIIRE